MARARKRQRRPHEYPKRTPATERERKRDMTVLLILLGITVIVALLIGLLAKLPPMQLVAECAVMCAATLVFFLLVQIL